VKTFFVSVALILFLFGSTGCQDKRVAPLEKRVDELELKVKSLQDAQEQAADARNQKDFQFKMCVQAANDDYFKDVRSNGTRNGTTYSVSVPVMREIEQRKKDKIEECKLLYR